VALLGLILALSKIAAILVGELVTLAPAPSLSVEPAAQTVCSSIQSRQSTTPELTESAWALHALDRVIAELDARLASLEREIAEVLRDGAWASSAAVLLSAPGIGLVTAA